MLHRRHPPCPSPSLSRRDWLKLSAAGVVGYSLSGWLRGPGRRGRGQPAAQALVHPAVDERRPQPDGHLRPQARPRQRRPLQGDRHQRARHQDQRASAEDRPAHGRHGPHPLDEHQGSATTAGPPTRCAPAIVPGGPVQYPTLGSLVSKELEQPGAELPSFVSIAPYRFFSPAAYGPGFLGPQYAPLVVGESQQSLIPIPGRQTATTRTRSRCRTSTCPPGVRRRARRRPRRAARRDAGRLPRQAVRLCPRRAIAAPTSGR